MACDDLCLDPDNCTPGVSTFACKARYWKRRPPTFRYTQGQDFFHNATVAEDIRNTLEVAAADGRELEYVGGGPATPPLASLGV